jgi:hypothetical protein
MAGIPLNRSGNNGGWRRRDILLGGLAAAFALARPARAGEGAAPVPACTLTPELTEGPYYLDRPKLRRDITEGKPGVPLLLRIALLDAGTCQPLSGAAIDIWHCDAGGVYSGYGKQGALPFPSPPPGQAMPPPGGAGAGLPFGMGPGHPDHPPPKPKATNHLSFLRGVQLTGADGVAEFRTIVPGWYVGRAVHIHLKAHVGGKPRGGRYAGGHVCHTGQFGFAEDFYDTIGSRQPYSGHQVPRTPLAQDGILGTGGPVLQLSPLGTGPEQGYLGTIAFAVDPQGVPRVR